MNEIKYRAYDKISKVMRDVKIIEWLNQEFNDDPYMVGFECGVYQPSTVDSPEEWHEDILWRKASEVEIMQYTGMKDKNKNDIFKGDVVKLDNQNIYVIAFSRDKPDNSPRDEVIGNIYENPDLLTKQEN